MTNTNNDELKKRIVALLKENTGTHFLDSGSTYGRHWQTNQTVDFDKKPRFTLELNTYEDEGKKKTELLVTQDLYHWLLDKVYISEESEDLNKLYKKLFKDSEESDFSDVDSFKEYIEKELGAKGLYGEGEPFITNTYKGEDTLSQTIQYLFFTIKDNMFIVLQIHNGCDVRGGYTTPQVFSVENESFLCNCDVYIGLDNSECLTTDDGYHWYLDGCSSPKIELEAVDGEPSENPRRIKINGKIRELIY